MQWDWCLCWDVLEELWMSLGEGRPFLWVCCSHPCHPFGFLGLLVLLFCTALWCSTAPERDRLLSKLLRGAALLVEESHPFASSPRRMNSFETGRRPGLRWWFWSLKLCVPVLFSNLNGFEVSGSVFSDCFWKMNPNHTLSPWEGEWEHDFSFFSGVQFEAGFVAWPLDWSSLPVLGLSP